MLIFSTFLFLNFYKPLQETCSDVAKTATLLEKIGKSSNFGVWQIAK